MRKFGRSLIHSPDIRCFSTPTCASSTLPPLETIHQRINELDVAEFKKRGLEQPLLIKEASNPDYVSTELGRKNRTTSIPAAIRWFKHGTLSYDYLSPFGKTVLPYELILDTARSTQLLQSQQEPGTLESQLQSIVCSNPTALFHRFDAPLSLFLEACKAGSRERLYIAQAQIPDLPQLLQDDLPVPQLVKLAGRGDVYGANIWLGLPPTYTPLHKDPNPNLFVQLANVKVVRLFRPSIGSSVFRGVQAQIGQSASSIFRGEEMMDGPERSALEEAVWGEDSESLDGFEATVSPGDALFIPKGWWHSIKSLGAGVNASANWWFR